MPDRGIGTGVARSAGFSDADRWASKRTMAALASAQYKRVISGGTKTPEYRRGRDWR
jgi:hypothetical protein